MLTAHSLFNVNIKDGAVSVKTLSHNSPFSESLSLSKLKL